MNDDDKFLALAGFVFVMLVVYPASPCGGMLMLIGLLAVVYFATQDD